MTSTGILMASGLGERLGPLATGVPAALLPVHDTPMICYPLAVLLAQGVRDVLLVAEAGDVPAYRRLLGSGADIGVTLDDAEQPAQGGPVAAILAACDSIDAAPVAVVRADTLIAPRDRRAWAGWTAPKRGASVWAPPVTHPRRFDEVTVDRAGPVASLRAAGQGSPSTQGTWSLTGLAVYDRSLLEVARRLSSSADEATLSDVHAEHTRQGTSRTRHLPRGTAWHQMDTLECLHDAAEWVRREQTWASRWVGAAEEEAWRAGRVGFLLLRARAEQLLPSAYGRHLHDLSARNEHRSAA